MAIDFTVGGLAGLGTVFASTHDVVAWPARFLLAAAVGLPIGLRRRYPLPAFSALVALAIGAAVVGLALPSGPSFILSFAAYALFTVTVGSSRLLGLAAFMAGLAVVLVMQLLLYLHQIPANRGGDLGWAAFALIIAWIVAYSARQRRLYVQLLQVEAASNAVAEERLRIARELHDVVAHSMSVIAVQAGYGQYVIEANPANAREALGAIQATSRDALEEMRRMLGVLRPQDRQGQPGGQAPPRCAPLGPAPDLGDLDRLIQRTRGAGLEVGVERSGRIRAVPAGVGLSAYRIIQEALTNVVKHAGGGARCTVSLAYGDAALRVVITDDGGRSLVPAAHVAVGSGHGLAGMRERAHLCGGDLAAGPLLAGGFQVTATLPLPGEIEEASDVEEASGAGDVSGVHVAGGPDGPARRVGTARLAGAARPVAGAGPVGVA